MLYMPALRTLLYVPCFSACFTRHWYRLARYDVSIVRPPLMTRHSLWRPFDQHGVPIAEKAVALFYRHLISVAYVFDASKCGYQH